jgi:signal transduction histidine kinase
MESEKALISYIVISSSAVVLMLVVIIFDIFLIYRKRKKITDQEIEIHKGKVDELFRKQEVEAVNAMLKGQSSERRRISQELHDRLGGILFAAKLYNHTIEKKLNEIKIEQQTGYEKLSSLLDEAVQEVRRISHDLYHSSLAKFGYTIAVKQLISAVESSNALKISYAVTGDLEATDEAIQQELYALTQEMLSNTLKHAAATQIEISIDVQDTIDFRFKDNGKGFDTQKKSDGIGLANIRQRTEKLNATLTLETSPGNGTLYYLSIPKG